MIIHKKTNNNLNSSTPQITIISIFKYKYKLENTLLLVKSISKIITSYIVKRLLTYPYITQSSLDSQ